LLLREDVMKKWYRRYQSPESKELERAAMQIRRHAKYDTG